MFVPKKALNGRHLETAFFRGGMEINWHRLAEEEEWAGMERSLTAYGAPLLKVTSLKYLGRVFAAEDNY